MKSAFTSDKHDLFRNLVEKQDYSQTYDVLREIINVEHITAAYICNCLHLVEENGFVMLHNTYGYNKLFLDAIFNLTKCLVEDNSLPREYAQQLVLVVLGQYLKTFPADPNSNLDLLMSEYKAMLLHELQADTIDEQQISSVKFRAGLFGITLD